MVVVAWIVYLYFNNLLDKKMHSGLLMDTLGTVLNLALLAVVGVIVNAFALSFSAGLLVAGIGIGVYFALKKFFRAKPA